MTFLERRPVCGWSRIKQTERDREGRAVGVGRREKKKIVALSGRGTYLWSCVLAAPELVARTLGPR